jgi:hypothetical protein
LSVAVSSAANGPRSESQRKPVLKFGVEHVVKAIELPHELSHNAVELSLKFNEALSEKPLNG